MRVGQRQFLGGTKDKRGQAALAFLGGKADAVRSKGAISIVLRKDGRITEADLTLWAREQGFSLNKQGDVYYVAIEKIALAG